MMTHTCIKPGCDNTYKSEEEEAYYCESCVAHNKQIAKEIDANARPRRNIKSGIEQYDSMPKVHGFPRVKL